MYLNMILSVFGYFTSISNRIEFQDKYYEYLYYKIKSISIMRNSLKESRD